MEQTLEEKGHHAWEMECGDFLVHQENPSGSASWRIIVLCFHADGISGLNSILHHKAQGDLLGSAILPWVLHQTESARGQPTVRTVAHQRRSSTEI